MKFVKIDGRYLNLENVDMITFSADGREASVHFHNGRSQTFNKPDAVTILRETMVSDAMRWEPTQHAPNRNR